MQKYPKIAVIQEIGKKLIHRIDMSLEDEILELQKETNARIEKAKIKLITENEEEVELF